MYLKAQVYIFASYFPPVLIAILMSSKMELFSTNNLLKEELIIHNNLTGIDFDLDNNKGKSIFLCLLF